MATINVTKGLIGKEDFKKGTGTFTRTTSTGGSQTMTEVSMNTWRPGVVHVDDFGADPTGATDSSDAIQNAIDSLVGTQGQIGVDSKGVGGRVVFGAGHYVAKGLHIKDTDANYNITLEGEGMWATTIENDDTSGGNCIDIEGQSTSLLQSVRVKDMSILGNSSSGCAIKIESAVRSVVFENLWIEDHAGGGIRVRGTIHNLTIKDCVLRSSDAAAWHTISNGNDKTDFTAIEASQSQVKNGIRISGCEIEGWFLGIRFGGRTRGATVRDCRFRNCVQGIRAQGVADSGGFIIGITISENSFDSNGIDITIDNDGGGDARQQAARGIIIANNYLSEALNVDQTYGNGVEYDDSGEAASITIKRCSGFVVSGNVFRIGEDAIIGVDYYINITSEADRGYLIGNTSDTQYSVTNEVNTSSDATNIWGQKSSFDAITLPLQETTQGFTATASLTGEAGLTMTGGGTIGRTAYTTQPADGVVGTEQQYMIYFEEGSDQAWIKCKKSDGTVLDGKIADLT